MGRPVYLAERLAGDAVSDHAARTALGPDRLESGPRRPVRRSAYKAGRRGPGHVTPARLAAPPARLGAWPAPAPPRPRPQPLAVG